MQAVFVQEQERVFEEEQREKEAALDEALDARAIRGEALGQDRHFRRYWWYPGAAPHPKHTPSADPMLHSPQYSDVAAALHGNASNSGAATQTGG